MSFRRQARTRGMAGLMALAVVVIASRAAEPRDTRPSVQDLVREGASYVSQFEKDFSSVVSDEDYEQHAERTRLSVADATTGRGGSQALRSTLSSENRTIHSETLFTWLGSEHQWVMVRNVVAVDRRAIPDSKDRLDRVFSGEVTRSRLRELAVQHRHDRQPASVSGRRRRWSRSTRAPGATWTSASPAPLSTATSGGSSRAAASCRTCRVPE